MINISIKIKIPELWKEAEFNKTDWGTINLIVGPNGTGKSLFADKLQAELNRHGYKARMLNAERLSGFEKRSYSHFGSSRLTAGINISEFKTLKSEGEQFGLSSSAFVLLKEHLDIRIKIEALLSDIFNKTIRLVEEGGYLKPKIQDNLGGAEFGLQQNECHGLKELITLLTFLYDDSKNCLILDEPELHLHPQYQSFFLSEIRKFAGDPKIDPSKKLFFIITHSPYFLDLRSIDDLKSILVCHYNQPPDFIDSLVAQDEYILKKFLPRFNTYHKQFFFSPNPVFVEGYTDQQIITLLFDKLDYNISASGSSIIDVGGKDELAVFFRLCKKLNIKARIIADLDAFFKGKLREVAQEDENCNKYIQDSGLGTDLSTLIGELDRKLKEVADDLVTKTATDSDLIQLIEFLKPLISVPDKRNTVIFSQLIALQKFKEKIYSAVSAQQQTNINYILPKFSLLLKAFESANIFIFPKGEIEHYYTQSAIDYLNFTDKEKSTSFHLERDYILSEPDITQLESKYADLILILKSSVPQIKVDLSKHLKFQIVEWLQTVQRAISKGDIANINGLKTHAKIDYKLFNQILEVTDLQIQADKRFVCKIKISKSLTSLDKEIDFNEMTIPHDFQFEI
ncbi:TOPRIM nucleotidyl transferase/hydrolase domain-containing protein [Flavobacterium sp. Fl-77]|uniref:TOPRIM nucleotidyl transferase/hydrolase domain-containing protein n=1 Tax=Flavobacterium flavipigmentatum TaxID=2893884 RepID=A0AAJ2W1Y6_9FLAO|nr:MULTISPECIES: TOPRIM nucleotidyl transferase/hydrolase domain-containing protein [unclassified Flavobacterium]MDX6183171.1 TOPRIM nucleotidyl transferase/hydrolase domain-containing protein [Flavobacterium sp. Fl-33]MDX6186760.1 TOPRIM nucleotidyl transferase/hydrolase domain-containing protein [Flavobacterium sp. Fl-77]UFH40414.1 AAA family ATPase [Flavobacterium sp. F-70]